MVAPDLGLVMDIEQPQDLDDKYEIVAGVFSRNYKINQSLGTSIGT